MEWFWCFLALAIAIGDTKRVAIFLGGKSKVSDSLRNTDKSSVGFETNFNRSYSKSRVHLQHKHTIIIVYSTFRSFSLVFPGYWAIHSLDNKSFCLPVRNGGWERSLSFDTTVQPGSNIHSARRSSRNPKKSRVTFPVQTSKLSITSFLMPSREASFCERSTCQRGFLGETSCVSTHLIIYICCLCCLDRLFQHIFICLVPISGAEDEKITEILP